MSPMRGLEGGGWRGGGLRKGGALNISQKYFLN